jgi:excisionase family DNA binding protein
MSLDTEAPATRIFRARRKPPPPKRDTSSVILALSPDEAAAAVGVSRSRMYWALRRGELTAYRDSKRTLIEPAELQRWIRAMPTRGRKPDPAIDDTVSE